MLLLKVAPIIGLISTIYLHPSLDSIISHVQENCLHLNTTNVDCQLNFEYSNILCTFSSSDCYDRLLKILSNTSRFGKIPSLEWRKIFCRGYTWELDILRNGSEYDPSIHDNSAIITSAECNQTEMVRFLLKDNRVNPSIKNNRALLFATYNGNLEIVKLLCEDRRTNCKHLAHRALSIAPGFSKFLLYSNIFFEKNIRIK